MAVHPVTETTLELAEAESKFNKDDVAGLDEGRVLEKLLAGKYNEKEDGPKWRAGFQPQRDMSLETKGSFNIPFLEWAIAYGLGELDTEGVAALRVAMRRQLEPLPGYQISYLDGTESGEGNYPSFTKASTIAILYFADKNGDTETADIAFRLLEALLNLACLFSADWTTGGAKSAYAKGLTVLGVGERCQFHYVNNNTAILALDFYGIAGIPSKWSLDLRTDDKQPSAWPIRIFAYCREQLGLQFVNRKTVKAFSGGAAEIVKKWPSLPASVRTSNQFDFYLFDDMRIVIMREAHNTNSVPCYVGVAYRDKGRALFVSADPPARGPHNKDIRQGSCVIDIDEPEDGLFRTTINNNRAIPTISTFDYKGQRYRGCVSVREEGVIVKLP